MDGISGAAVRSIVEELRAMPASERVRACRERHPDFAEAFPALLKACADDSFDMRFLDMMLSRRDALRSGAADADAVERADGDVYAALREHYVTPLLAQQSNKRRRGCTGEHC